MHIYADFEQCQPKKKDGKNVYFLTEFLGGGDLFTAIREIGNLSKRQAQRLGEIGPG
jgi:hypothetical protein